jgi:hypothetical protein
MEAYGTASAYGTVATGNVRNQGGASLFWEGTSGPLSIAAKSTYMRFYSGGETSAFERMRIDNTGNVGIGTTGPGSKLDVKGALRLSGSTSGYAGFQPAAAAGSTVWTLPTADGAGGQFLTTNGGGILSWSSPSGTLSGLTVGQVGVASGTSSMSGNSGFTFNSSTGLQLTTSLPVNATNSSLTIYPTFNLTGTASTLVMAGQNIQTTTTISGANTNSTVLGQKIFNQRMNDAGTLSTLAGQQIYFGHFFKFDCFRT